MQRFPASDAKYAYSPEHASIGTVEPGERLRGRVGRGLLRATSARRRTSRPSRTPQAEAHKWAVVGPDHRRRRESRRRRRGDDPRHRGHDARRRRLRRLQPRRDPYEWWDDESGCRRLSDRGRRRALRRAARAADAAADRLPRGRARQRASVHAKLQGRYGGNLDCRELRAGATIVLPVEHDGAGLYFGDCKALMGDSEIVGPPEVGALVTASAEPVQRPASMEWPRIETRRRADDARLRQAARVERAAGIPRAPELGRRRLRPAATEGGAAARDGRACRHRADQQHATTRRTASTPRDVLGRTRASSGRARVRRRGSRGRRRRRARRAGRRAGSRSRTRGSGRSAGGRRRRAARRAPTTST